MTTEVYYKTDKLEAEFKRALTAAIKEYKQNPEGLAVGPNDLTNLDVRLVQKEKRERPEALISLSSAAQYELQVTLPNDFSRGLLAHALNEQYKLSSMDTGALKKDSFQEGPIERSLSGYESRTVSLSAELLIGAMRQQKGREATPR